MKAIPPRPQGLRHAPGQLRASRHRTKDPSLPRVLATPVMIMTMENAALNALKPYLEQGETAVGIRIDIRHLSPTRLACASSQRLA